MNMSREKNIPGMDTIYQVTRDEQYSDSLVSSSARVEQDLSPTKWVGIQLMIGLYWILVL